MPGQLSHRRKAAVDDTVTAPRGTLLVSAVTHMVAAGIALAAVFVDRWHTFTVGRSAAVTVGLHEWEVEAVRMGLREAAFFPSCAADADTIIARLNLARGIVIAAAALSLLTSAAALGMSVTARDRVARVGGLVLHPPGVLSLIVCAVSIPFTYDSLFGHVFCDRSACDLVDSLTLPTTFLDTFSDAASGSTFTAANSGASSCSESLDISFVLLCVAGALVTLGHLLQTWGIVRYCRRYDRARRLEHFAAKAATADGFSPLASIAAAAAIDRREQRGPAETPPARRPRLRALPGGDSSDDDEAMQRARIAALEEDFDAASIPGTPPHTPPTKPVDPADLAAVPTSPAPVLGDAAEGTQWVFVPSANMYYSELHGVYWDPATGVYFDPATQEWIDPTTGVRTPAVAGGL